MNHQRLLTVFVLISAATILTGCAPTTAAGSTSSAPKTGPLNTALVGTWSCQVGGTKGRGYSPDFMSNHGTVTGGTTATITVAKMNEQSGAYTTTVTEVSKNSKSQAKSEDQLEFAPDDLVNGWTDLQTSAFTLWIPKSMTTLTDKSQTANTSDGAPNWGNTQVTASASKITLTSPTDKPKKDQVTVTCTR